MDTLIGQRPPATPGQPGQPAPGNTATGEFITTGTQATFMKDVIEASRTVPVLVDFWATWCGPCKTLTPAIERVVTAAAGRVKLVKIDIDQNRALVQQLSQLGLPLQSVPTVAAFWQGQIADIFQGALPESEIKKFVEALLKLAGGAMPSADLLAEAKAALDENQAQEAGELFSQLLQDEPENPDAWAGLVRALAALGQEEDAAQALSQVPAAIRDHAEIASVRAALALAEEGRRASALLGDHERRLAADPADHEARYELATALNGLGRRQDAADALLHIIRADRTWNEGAARAQLLKFFEAWGFDDPAAAAGRRRLSSILFS